MIFARWTLVLPAAVMCAYGAYIVGSTVNNISFYLIIGSLSGWAKIASDAMAHIYLGGAFCYSAVRIAPSAPRYIASAAFALLLAFASLLIWSMFAIAKFYVLPAVGGALFGGLAVLIATFQGEVVPFGTSPN